MKTENPIDEFIRKEKSIAAGADLTNKIMDQLLTLESSSITHTDPTNKRTDGKGRMNEVVEKSSRNWTLQYRSVSRSSTPSFAEQSKSTGWHTLAIAASFALVIATGIGTGRMYSVTENNATALNINDTHIENHSLLNSLAYE